MSEPLIIINGVELTVGQSMTVRVAIQLLLMDLAARGLGKDEHGLRMTAGYQRLCGEINEIMHGQKP